MDGKWQTRNLLKAFQINRTVALAEVMFLVFLGAVAVLIRAKLRIPLNLPGHHGLEIMALLLFGRGVSKINVASSISSLAASIFILFPFMGFKDPFLPVIYILMGVMIDFLYIRFKDLKPVLFFMVILGGIAYMIIPLSRLFVHLISGYPYMSFIKHGYFLPLLSHFIFGSFGALVATGLSSTFNKTFRKV